MLAMPASRQPAVPDAQTCQATKVAILPLSKGKAGYKEASQNLQAAADSASDELQGAIGILAGYYDEMAKDNPDQAMLNQVEQSVPWKNANDTLYRICGTSEIHQ